MRQLEGNVCSRFRELVNRVTVEIFIIPQNTVPEGLSLRLVEMSPVHYQEEREDEVQLLSETRQAQQTS